MGKFRLTDIDNDRTAEFELTQVQFAELKRLLKDFKNAPQNDYKGIVTTFNTTCRSLPPVTRITEKRRRGIAKLLKEGIDVGELFSKTAASPFLNGKNGMKWHATFDWLIIPSNAVKVIEGNYEPIRNEMQPQPPMSGNPFDDYG